MLTPREDAVDFNYIIIDLFNIPDEISFQIHKYSSKTSLIDIRNEDFLSFLQANDYNVKYKSGTLGRVIFSVKISKIKTKTHYAFTLVEAVKAALDEFETVYRVKHKQKEYEAPDRDEARIVHNVISQKTVLTNSKRKGSKINVPRNT